MASIEEKSLSRGTGSASGVPRICLVANSSAVQQFLPSEIGSFSRRVPEARVDLMEAFSYDIPRIVAAGEADIGVYHAAHPAPGVVSLPYRTDRVGLVVPVGHPLCMREKLRLEDALDYDFVGYFPRHSLEEFMQLISPPLPRPLRVRAQVSNTEARCDLVREGLGLAIVPVGIAVHYEARMGLIVLPLDDDWAHRQLWVCVAERAALSPAAQEFLAHLVSDGSLGKSA